jgi:hypothetical protein
VIKKRGNSWWVAVYTGRDPLTGKKRQKTGTAERAYAKLSADGAPVSAGQLAAAAGLSASYARALVAQFHAQPPTALQYNGAHPATDADRGAPRA